jgi:hypothetical protein
VAVLERLSSRVYLRKTDCVVIEPPNPQAPLTLPTPSGASSSTASAAVPVVTKVIAPSEVPPPQRLEWTHHTHITDSSQTEELAEMLLSKGRMITSRPN